METNGAYCRDALTIILKEYPQIIGLTMRVHGESGIPEGSFSSISEHVHALLDAKADPKYSPIEVAQWLDDYSTPASQFLAIARKQTGATPSIEFRRMEEDTLILIGLGQFFAAKLRSGLLYEIYDLTGNAEAGKFALA